MVNKTCSFIGHREIDNYPYLESMITEIVEILIKNYDVTNFLFGSNSQFDTVCHKVVTKLKEIYPFITRVVYTCKSEECVYENNRLELEKRFSKLLRQPVEFKGFEKEVEHKNKYVAGRASYVERNFAMINDSDFCIFYYNENYTPKTEKRRNGTTTSSNSGTKLAYAYAIKSKKTVINLFQKEKTPR